MHLQLMVSKLSLIAHVEALPARDARQDVLVFLVLRCVGAFARIGYLVGQ